MQQPIQTDFFLKTARQMKIQQYTGYGALGLSTGAFCVSPFFLIDTQVSGMERGVLSSASSSTIYERTKYSYSSHFELAPHIALIIGTVLVALALFYLVVYQPMQQKKLDAFVQQNPQIRRAANELESRQKALTLKNGAAILAILTAVPTIVLYASGAFNGLDNHAVKNSLVVFESWNGWTGEKYPTMRFEEMGTFEDSVGISHFLFALAVIVLAAAVYHLAVARRFEQAAIDDLRKPVNDSTHSSEVELEDVSDAITHTN